MSTAQQQQLYSLQEQYITEVTEPEGRVVIHVNGELGPHGGLAVEESGGADFFDSDTDVTEVVG